MNDASQAARDAFANRHLGVTPAEIGEMAASVGYETLDAMIDAAVPAGIRLENNLDLPGAVDEMAALDELRSTMARNTFRSSS